ncbi:hypothetical protein Pmani_036034 [Petrolisthes manimaculis]|uniref:Transmembrane protein 70 n=1 Tax=Petrolisthes manimaculis TaxID=1843537 RepID=A0AAE1NJB1_9EUCA|nr:hypothetical protein Pmani_036034 [Petrolisthes manimaculis]
MAGVCRGVRRLASLCVAPRSSTTLLSTTTTPSTSTTPSIFLHHSFSHTCLTSSTQKWGRVSLGRCVGARMLSTPPPSPPSPPPPSPPSPPPANTPPENEVDIGPGTWQEIYHGVLATQIKIVKTFSLSTSLLGVCIQPVIFQSAGSHVGLAVAVGSFVGFFTFVTPFLIHWISKKYVTTLHYDPNRDVYVATTLSFFLREKKFEFQVGDIHVPEIPGPFTTLYARSRPLFLDPGTFSEFEHYGRLMGYDKPIDLHADDQGRTDGRDDQGRTEGKDDERKEERS